MKTAARSTISSALVRIRTAGAALLLAAAAAAPAHAQLGSRTSLADAFRPDILQRDITLIDSTLRLDELQRQVVETLMQDYMTAFNTGVENLKERMKSAQQDATRANPTNPDAILEKIMAPLNEWRAEKRAMSDRFMADLKNQLGPQQQEQWPAFERALRRERLLPDGDLSGESVDLWAAVSRMDPTSVEQESIKPVMAAYEVALDEALLARERELQRVEDQMAAAMKAMNLDGMADAQEKVMVFRVKVREANDAAIESIAAAMGDRGAEFRRRALEAGYPDVFRIHPVTVLIQQARAIEGLTDEQRAQIDALASQFAGACDEENLKILASVRAEEPKGPRRRAEARKARTAPGAAGAPVTGQGPSPDDPIVKGRVEKERMGQPFRDQLMAMLTPEQQAQLPGGIKVDPAGTARENQGRPKGAMIGGVEPGDEGVAKDAAAGDRDSRRRDPRSAPGAPDAPPAPEG
jgi:hypothetical protein